MDVIRTGDILVVTALERLGRDTLGLLELINRAGHHGRGAEGAGYAGDALERPRIRFWRRKAPLSNLIGE